MKANSKLKSELMSMEQFIKDTKSNSPEYKGISWREVLINKIRRLSAECRPYCIKTITEEELEGIKVNEPDIYWLSNIKATVAESEKYTLFEMMLDEYQNGNLIYCDYHLFLIKSSHLLIEILDDKEIVCHSYY